MPNLFRQQIEEAFGRDLFVTSIHGRNFLLYPLPIWRALEEKLAELPAIHRAKNKFLERVNYYGQDGAIDGQGRILVPQILRDTAKLAADVVVTGNIDHLVVSDHAALAKRLCDRGLRARGLRRTFEAASLTGDEVRLKRARTSRFFSTRSSSCSRPSAADSSWTPRSARAGTRRPSSSAAPASGCSESTATRTPSRAPAESSRALPAASSSSSPISASSIACSTDFLPPDGILADLGVSSMQLNEAERGFSFRRDGPLDMRMGKNGRSAADIVATASVEELTRIFRDFGEERMAAKIARGIVAERARGPIVTTRQLARVVAEHKGGREKIDPATRVFQALRIEVNQELQALARFLSAAVSRLNGGGRLAVISYHSLEDRMVKEVFRRDSGVCLCPPKMPACVCGARKALEVLTRRPLRPGEAELHRNSRSRSARLRVAEKVAEGGDLAALESVAI